MASIKIEIEPFPVPSYVTLKMPAGKRQDGVRIAPTLTLSELTDDALEVLIEEFAASVMAAARPT